MHHEGLDLTFEDLHASGGNHRANIRHHNLAQDVADEPVVPLETSCRCMLHGETVVIV